MNDSFTWPVVRDEKLQSGAGQHSSLPAALAYFVACAIAGAATGTVLGGLGLALGALAPDASAALLILLAAVAIRLELRGRVSPLPERRKQVPTGWLSWRPRWRTAVAFGLMLGAGGFTHLRHAVIYVLAAVVLLSASIEVGAALGALYGASRGAVLVVTWFGDRFLGRRLRWDRISRARRFISRVLVALSLVAIASALSVL